MTAIHLLLLFFSLMNDCVLVTSQTPQLLDASLLSSSPSTSCATIYDSSGTANMKCDKATVLQLALSPNTDGGGFEYIFNNDAQLSPSGGAGQPICDEKNPGACVMGTTFIVRVDVSPMKLSYALDMIGLDVPFGYAYANCLTRAPGYAGKDDNNDDANNPELGGPYPEVVGDNCGPTMVYNLDDYQKCDDPTSFNLGDFAIYSECIFECSPQKNLDIKNKIPCDSEKKKNDLREDFTHPEGVAPPREHLACRELDPEYTKDIEGCMPNFPIPSSLCPCGGGITGTDPAAADLMGAAYLVPTTACKSGVCAGTCGSAYPLSKTDLGDNYPCDIDDPTSLCINTNQKHRCLKCQPTIYKDGTKNHPERWCYYFDIHNGFRCSFQDDRIPDNPEFDTNLDITDVCGNGDYLMGGYNNPTRSQDDSLLHRDTRACNCDANFVEKIYPVTPICNTFIIRNPVRYEYDVTVTFRNIDNATEIIPGSIMSVGGGWAPWDLEYPPDITTPLSNYTPDGFALSRILSIDSSTGKKSDDLHGFIVVCDDSRNPVCTTETITDTITGNTSNPINYANLPTTHINVSSVDGKINPWGTRYFSTNEAKVPLPHQLYRYADANAGGDRQGDTAAKQNHAWWYYVPEREMRNYNRGCNGIGYYSGSDSDAATARTMCQGPQGTCVPGIDTITRGEIVNPPCNVVGDFYKFLWKNGGSYKSYEAFNSSVQTACYTESADQQKTSRIPKHVPIDWNPQTPNYWVHAGRLFKDPSTSDRSDLTIRLSISIAADFQGEVIVQEPGIISLDAPVPSCSLFVDLGTGSFTVGVSNTGTESAEYTLITNCTQGIIAKDLSFGLAPGIGGSANVQVVSLTILTSAKFAATPEQTAEGIIVPACTANLYPYVLAGNSRALLSSTVPTRCILDYGLPIIIPIHGPDVVERAASEYVIKERGTSCSIFNPMCDQFFNRDGGFSAAQHTLIAMMIMITILSSIVCCYTSMVESVAVETAEMKGYMAGIDKASKKSEGDSFASKQRVAKLLLATPLEKK